MRYTVGGMVASGASGIFLTWAWIAALGFHPVTAAILAVVALILLVFCYSLIERGSRRQR